MADRILRSLGRILRVLAIVVGVAVVTFMVLTSGLLPTGSSDVERAVAAELRDPESARFRRIAGNGDTICGEVNARNALGAYTGFQPFVYRLGVVLFEPKPGIGLDAEQQARYLDEITQFTRWQQACHQ